MKVRITGNKIRLRLKEPEIQALYQGGSINEVLAFGAQADQQLNFRLETYDDSCLGVTYKPGIVTMHMPAVFSETLATTGKIGYEDTVTLQQGNKIYLLIEKDFECLDTPEEEEGSYPNPNQAC